HRTAADRAHLLTGLAELAPYGLKVTGPAEAPFVLLELPDAQRVRHRLRELGYAVRRGDTFPGLGPDWLRVAVRDRTTTAGFVQALGTALTQEG
ncbi:aminotransferase, partial [Streptomyces sp. SID1328]|nr:aminotransferase [Streptomyces sp. SID1328]